jgi:hypothetical protein
MESLILPEAQMELNKALKEFDEACQRVEELAKTPHLILKPHRKRFKLKKDSTNGHNDRNNIQLAH